VLGRYVLREVLVPYLVGVFLFAALLTFDLLSSLSGVLLSRGVGAREVGLLVLYRLPWTLSLALPLPPEEGLRLEQDYARLSVVDFYGEEGVVKALNLAVDWGHDPARGPQGPPGAS